MLVYYIYNAFPPFLAARQSTRNWRRMTSFVSLLPRKRSSVPVRFHRLNCSYVVAIVVEIVETTIFLLAREVENKIYKGGIVWISECYLSKMSSHVILSYPPLVWYTVCLASSSCVRGMLHDVQFSLRNMTLFVMNIIINRIPRG